MTTTLWDARECAAQGHEPQDHIDPSEVAVQRECTDGEGAQWEARYGDGYRAGRGDARARPRRMREGAQVTIPADLPGETGTQYIARHVGLAWRIGYTRAWQFETARA